MPERVVDGLEAVEIEEEQGELAPFARGVGNRFRQALLERQPVRQAREAVAVRGIEQHVLRALELRHVDRHADRADHVALGVRQGFDVVAQPAFGTRPFQARRLAGEHVAQHARLHQRLGRPPQQVVGIEPELVERAAGNRREPPFAVGRPQHRVDVLRDELQAPFALAQAQLRAGAFADVAQRDQRFGRGGMDAQLDPRARRRKRVRALDRRGGPPPAPNFGNELGRERVDDAVQPLAHQRAGGAAQQPFRLFVDMGDDEILVDDVDAVPDGFEQVELLLGRVGGSRARGISRDARPPHARREKRDRERRAKRDAHGCDQEWSRQATPACLLEQCRP